MRIEAYDAAHLGGSAMVGVMTVVENGSALKNDYRKFKIKAANAGDDIGALREMLSRRLTHDEWPCLGSLLLMAARLSLMRPTKRSRSMASASRWSALLRMTSIARGQYKATAALSPDTSMTSCLPMPRRIALRLPIIENFAAQKWGYNVRMRTVVGVLRGGPWSEYEVSLKSGASVLSALDQKRRAARLVYCARRAMAPARRAGVARACTQPSRCGI